jgi:hypothetical protein
MSKKCKDEIMNSAKAPFVFGSTLLLLVVCEPSNYTGTGPIFVYPMYTDHYVQGLFTTGTWVWIYLLISLGETHLNDKFHAGCYDFVNGGSMYVYLMHYLFI